MLKLVKYPADQIFTGKEEYWDDTCPICSNKVLKSNCYYIVDIVGGQLINRGYKHGWCCSNELCMNITILRVLCWSKKLFSKIL